MRPETRGHLVSLVPIMLVYAALLIFGLRMSALREQRDRAQTMCLLTASLALDAPDVVIPDARRLFARCLSADTIHAERHP